MSEGTAPVSISIDARVRLGSADRMGSDRALSSPEAFAILGRRLDAHLCTPPLRAWLARHWRHHEHEPDNHPYHILLSSTCPDVATTPSIDEAPYSAGGSDVCAVDIRLPGDFTLHWTTRDGEWRSGDEAAGVHACFDAGESRIAVWGTTNAADRMRALPRIGAAPPWPALYVAFCEALRASGLIPLHAAVVVHGRDAIALTGPSGTGKTTTLLRLLGRGWRPLAEDLSWLDPASRTLYGWDRGLRLWPDAVARLGRRIASAPWTVDRDGKRRLDWNAVPAARVAQATLTRIVVLERDDARPSSITRLSRPAAVRVLWEATGVPLTPWVRDKVARHIARLARTLEHARLTIGAGDLPEPDTAPSDE